jgi:threonine dehydrogenase-like Zn-dependent dehydrogenase
MTHHRGSDVILFTAGSPETVNDALSWVRDGGTLVFFSELSQEKGPLNFKEIYKREITLTSSYSPGPEDLQEAFELISQKQVDLNEIPMDSFPLEEIPKAVEMTLARKIFKAAIYPWKQ